ncbi:hypothetical protein FRC18_001284 [Serendipita sp. 400]|nr:hypothetical protein FRC18_001284 [Serendipita sp. 400]
MSQDILRLLLRMIDTVDEVKLQHMRNWFNEQNPVKFWRPNKPLACAVCHMAIKNAQKVAEHLYRCHSPDKTDHTKTCCGCVFPSQEKLQGHVNRDHPKRQIRLQHSDYTGLSEEALAILFLDEPHFSLVDTLSGNNPEAKGRMLNLIADARPHGRPLMVLKRKKGFRVNNGVSMVCCGICATPRSNVQEMALHLNSDHLKHQGFGCPDKNCKEKFSSFDSLKKHADDIHDVQLKSHRVKVANDRRLSVNLSAQEDGSHQMKTKSESSRRDRMSLVSSSSSSSSTSPSPQTTPIQADTGEGRNATSSTQQQRRQMGDLSTVDQPPLQSTDRQEPVSAHGLADLSGPWPVRPKQPDITSGEQPPPLTGHSPPAGTTHTLHQSHPLYSIMENGRYNVYTSLHPPSHLNYTQANDPYVDPQLQNPIGRQTHVVGPSRISGDIFCEEISRRMDRCHPAVVHHVLSTNPTDAVNGERWGEFSEHQRALLLFLDKGIRQSIAEMQARVPLGGSEATIDPALDPTFTSEYNRLIHPNSLDGVLRLMSPTTTIATGYATSPPMSVSSPQVAFREGAASDGSGMQTDSLFDLWLHLYPSP